MQPLEGEFVDGENRPVTADVVYPVRGSQLLETVRTLRQKHGPDARFLPMSGQSGGSGVFQVSPPSDTAVIGLKIQPALQPIISTCRVTDLAAMGLDEIVVDEERGEICAGAAITLDQLGRTLREVLGEGFYVRGADLTSYGYAQVGATFMTGGMGPQRFYFSDSVTGAAIFDGDALNEIEGDELAGYAGTYGWSGIVSAVRCRYHRFPAHEIAFALPVDQSPESLARLIDRLGPLTALDGDRFRLLNTGGGTDLVTGIEHVTAAAMGPLLNRSGDGPITRRASALASNCQHAGADGLVFITAFSNLSADEFIMGLVDDADAERPCIAGIDLEFSEFFERPEEMREVREAIPFAARTQVPAAAHVFKGHTDATVCLAPERRFDTMRTLWEYNCRYVNAVERTLNRAAGIDGEILVYGHLNPAGIDPHNRLTFWSDDEAAFLAVKKRIDEHLREYMLALFTLCETSGSVFVGGEKSAASDRELVDLCGGVDALPGPLVRRIRRQQDTVRNAPEAFRWRSLPPYCP